jgi:peptidyl-tRNA hydrolase
MMATAATADSTLRLYAIIRTDAGMSPGKQVSQGGHAYLGAFIEASKQTPDAIAAYTADGPGTKVTLRATLDQICRAQLELQDAGIPHFTMVDSGHMPFHNGKPTLTSLGFGPCTKEQLPKYIKRLQSL